MSYVRSEYRDRHQRLRRADFVAKLATGQAARETSAYRPLLSGYAGVLAPRLLGIGRPEQDAVRIYLDWIRRVWPWRDLRLLARTMDFVAEAHTCLSDSWFRAPHDHSCWDYERAVLHEDIHSGNVAIRARERRRAAFLLDWGLTRLGSPLEDVSSWLQSLRCWEPEAKRGRDSLLQRYLGARGFSTRLSPGLRENYWTAVACNGLASAIRYRLLTFSECRSRKARISSLAALHDWLRVRRADAACRA